MRRSAIVYATVAMVELSQQRLQGMVLATVRKSWRQSHAGIRLLPGFWGLRGVDRTPLRPLVASPPFRMTVPSLVIGSAAATGFKCSTDAFGRREANAKPQRTAIDAAFGAICKLSRRKTISRRVVTARLPRAHRLGRIKKPGRGGPGSIS